MCKRGGFNLHKFTSNRKEVIQQIPFSDRAEGMKDMDFSREPLPMVRALGVQWCIESVTFNFTISPKDRPCTRRGIRCTTRSVSSLQSYQKARPFYRSFAVITSGSLVTRVSRKAILLLSSVSMVKRMDGCC